MRKKYTATLVKGENYRIKGIAFKRGESKPVTDEQKAQLEKAVSVLTATDESGKPVRIEKPKFEFSDAKAEATADSVEDAAEATTDGKSKPKAKAAK